MAEVKLKEPFCLKSRGHVSREKITTSFSFWQLPHQKETNQQGQLLLRASPRRHLVSLQHPHVWLCQVTTRACRLFLSPVSTVSVLQCGSHRDVTQLPEVVAAPALAL